jgi:hypothetical protein
LDRQMHNHLPRAMGKANHILAAIHHRKPQHWTLVAFDVMAAQVKWYNPMSPSPIRSFDMAHTLLRWAETAVPLQTLSYSFSIM